MFNKKYYYTLIYLFLLFPLTGFGQGTEEVKIIITDINDVEVIRKDTIVSKAIPLESVISEMGYDPATVAMASNTQEGRKISIEVTEVEKDNTPPPPPLKRRGMSAEEVDQLLRKAYTEDSLSMATDTSETEEAPTIDGFAAIIIAPFKTHSETFGPAIDLPNFPRVKVTYSPINDQELEELKLKELNKKEEVLNISNFKIKPDYTEGLFRLSFNHFGATTTTLKMYDENFKMIYHERLMENHFNHLIEKFPIQFKGVVYAVWERTDKEKYFARKVNIERVSKK